ncbi:type IX secretion system sortase PorU [Chitinophaga pendula]|uniref:type IX secretion system sortase PorU n=1 Tax=Chitinophaga TaxID=79328 RepID=UPI000BB08FBC|nr:MULTISPECIES: type IX secretion system sortase PorU [Chitinophaga]ASZ10790.1 hypothetical protein CK934_07265 [Chitinophaga sp. MD30]UCJ06232.1 type IX secretion system sortase PorU [Chitinophaga pendula]
MKYVVLLCLLMTSVAAASPSDVLRGDTLAGGGRPYAAHSVLASGSWYKLGITAGGVYKIDISLLQSLGINTNRLSAGTIRLYGNGGQLLPEDNQRSRPDDLREVALQVSDGGDGILDGNDYLLFYAPGPHRWQYQSFDGSYSHTYHLYSDTAYYFLTTGGEGKRIAQEGTTAAVNRRVDSYDYYAFYEQDSVNLLNSGKQWWGRSFGDNGGLTRYYPFTLPMVEGSSGLRVKARVAGRSGVGSRFELAVNEELAGTVFIAPVSGNIFEGVASVASGSFQTAVRTKDVNIRLRFIPRGAGAQGWLDYLEVQGRSILAMPAAGQLAFRDAGSVNTGGVAAYQLRVKGMPVSIWDVSTIDQPVQLETQVYADSVTFRRDCGLLREFVAFTPGAAMRPFPLGAVANQDLHGSSGADMIIITTAALLPAARRLAAYHQAHDGLSVQVTDVQQVYLEFAGGTPDPTAIRDFLKMYYDRGQAGKYLLLFGDASYDYKNRVANNTNLVPTWQSAASTDAINSYGTDDYYGFLDDDDDILDSGRKNLLDIAIGRIPVRQLGEAEQVVDKIAGYHSPDHFGSWRTRMMFVADDEDHNLHLEDAEAVSAVAARQAAVLTADKVYLDAFPQIAGAGGSRYPAVNEAIRRGMSNGMLIWNYSGHGSYTRLAEEAVVTDAALTEWKTAGHLPLLVTATCDFAPFDNPAILSLGEKLLLQPDGGVIALMTTTRAVLAYSNRVIHMNYLHAALTPGASGRMPSMGMAAMRAKNETYRTSGDIANNRKFQLLGDPALTLAFPSYKVVTDSINGMAVGAGVDTLRALGMYEVSGHVEDLDGKPVTDFTGMIYSTVYDKPSVKRTLGNDPESEVADYTVQRNVLYSGRHTVAGGKFRYTFVVPKDIDYKAGEGKIVYYAAGEKVDAAGVLGAVQIGGTAVADKDETGPAIRVYLDNEWFKDGGITGENPVLLVHLADSSGINTTGYGIGHQMTGMLDGTGEYFILNDYFEASLNSYRRGSIRYPLYNLPEGWHDLEVRAWDTYNNSGKARIRFKVVKASTLAIEEAGNYPNPFYDVTRFFFHHNQQGQLLELHLEVFTGAGQLVKSKRETIKVSGQRYEGMLWDGTSNSGAHAAPGIYYYRLTVSQEGRKRVLSGKLMRL